MAPVGDRTACCFNVGGTKYEVARSTIEKYPTTMLARLISDTWQPQGQSHQKEEEEEEADANTEIFIDADGLNFRYVLEYMRHQSVELPMNASKASVLKDLKYFGFDDVSAACICTKVANLEYARHWPECCKDHEIKMEEQRAKVKKCQDELEEQERLADYMEIAHLCFKSFSRLEYHPVGVGGHSVNIPDNFRKSLPYNFSLNEGGHSVNIPDNFRKLDTYLAEYGLSCTRVQCRCNVYVIPLEEE